MKRFDVCLASELVTNLLALDYEIRKALDLDFVGC